MKKLLMNSCLVLSLLVFAAACASTNTADNAGSDDTTVRTARTSAKDTAADGTSRGADRGGQDTETSGTSSRRMTTKN